MLEKIFIRVMMLIYDVYDLHKIRELV
jgi:hypothetical protein